MEGFWTGFGVVLGDFLVLKGGSKAKGSISGNGCFPYVILSFSGVVSSIVGARKGAKRNTNPIWIPSRFCDDFGTILGGISRDKIPKRRSLPACWAGDAFASKLGENSGGEPWRRNGPGRGWEWCVLSKIDAKVCSRLGGRAFPVGGDGPYPLILCIM